MATDLRDSLNGKQTEDGWFDKVLKREGKLKNFDAFAKGKMQE